MSQISMPGAPPLGGAREPLRWPRRKLLALATLLICLPLLGFAYQTIASAVDARNNPPPGRLVDVGGYNINHYPNARVYQFGDSLSFVFDRPLDLDEEYGAHCVHIYYASTPTPSSPTGTMDTGLGSESLNWALVQPKLLRQAHACTFDRPGYGWSDPGPVPATPASWSQGFVPCSPTPGYPRPTSSLAIPTAAPVPSSTPHSIYRMWPE